MGGVLYEIIFSTELYKDFCLMRCSYCRKVIRSATFLMYFMMAGCVPVLFTYSADTKPWKPFCKKLNEKVKLC